MIRVLDKTVSDKIAAGEVVDRPLSIVKELVENSIDSGATSIICEIKNGGKTYIRVTDNGCGIPESEAELAFL
ncbi:MAG: ATP-binding protein, partial [Firmicutes bacterium]|nr:ATP-binding protein [Bacillota bacterium]